MTQHEDRLTRAFPRGCERRLAVYSSPLKFDRREVHGGTPRKSFRHLDAALTVRTAFRPAQCFRRCPPRGQRLEYVALFHPIDAFVARRWALAQTASAERSTPDHDNRLGCHRARVQEYRIDQREQRCRCGNATAEEQRHVSVNPGARTSNRTARTISCPAPTGDPTQAEPVAASALARTRAAFKSRSASSFISRTSRGSRAAPSAVERLRAGKTSAVHARSGLRNARLARAWSTIASTA